MERLSFKKLLIGIFAVVLVIFAIRYIGKLAVVVDSDEIVVIQGPIDGKLHVYVGGTPEGGGMVAQNFGTVTRYKKSFQHWFAAPKYVPKGNDDGADHSIKMRFNDGGHADLSGSIRIDMPTDAPSVIALHTKYGSQDAVEKALVAQLITKSVYMTGPMMSSKESNAERRNELIGYIEDQAINGVYKTYVTTSKVKDPMDDNQERTVSVVKIAEENNTPIREEKSPAKEFNLRLYNLTINSIDYYKDVEDQIQAQQKLSMQVQTAVAQAKTAEQQAFTAEKEGEANAAKAKWAQETENAKIVAEADGRRRAATQDALAAEQEKKANILRGEGEGAYKRAVMQANGALEQKLEAYVKVQGLWAEAFSKYGGNIVPQIQTGAGGGGNGNGATNFQDLMSMKAARDLSLDLGASGSTGNGGGGSKKK